MHGPSARARVRKVVVCHICRIETAEVCNAVNVTGATRPCEAHSYAERRASIVREVVHVVIVRHRIILAGERFGRRTCALDIVAQHTSGLSRVAADNSAGYGSLGSAGSWTHSLSRGGG
jgi:hypothetical protein